MLPILVFGFISALILGTATYATITAFSDRGSSSSGSGTPGQGPQLNAPPLEVQGGSGQGGSDGQGGSGGDGNTGNTPGRVVGQPGAQDVSADQANPPLSDEQRLEALNNLKREVESLRREASEAGMSQDFIDSIDQELAALTEQIRQLTPEQVTERVIDIQDHIGEAAAQIGSEAGPPPTGPQPGPSGMQQGGADQRPAGGGPMRGQGQDGGQVGPRQGPEPYYRVPGGMRIGRYQVLRNMGYSYREASRYAKWPPGTVLPAPGTLNPVPPR